MSVPQFHQLDKAFSLDEIRDRLNDGSFWSHYSIEYSPGDGHCFMHSVKSSLKSQLSIDVSIRKIINAHNKGDNVKSYWLYSVNTGEYSH